MGETARGAGRSAGGSSADIHASTGMVQKKDTGRSFLVGQVRRRGRRGPRECHRGRGSKAALTHPRRSATSLRNLR